MALMTGIRKLDHNEPVLLLDRELFLREEEDTPTQKVLRISTKVFTVLLSAAGGISPMAASLKLAGSSFAGYLFLGANYVAFCANTSWAFHKAIDEEIKRVKFAQGEIATPESTPWIQLVLLKIPVLVLSGASIAPDIYNAYYYNSGSVVFPLLTCFCGIGLPFYSLNLTFKALLQERSKNEFEKKLSQQRLAIQGKLQSIKRALVNSSEEGSQSILLIDPLDVEIRERLMTVLELLPQGEAQPPSSIWQRRRRWAAIGLGNVNGGIGVIALAIYNFVLGSKASRLIYDQPYFYYLAALFILLSNGIVPVQVIMRNGRNLFENLLLHPSQLFAGNGAIGQIQPFKRSVAGVLALTLSILSLGPALQAVNDSFSGVYLTAMQIALLNAVLLLTFNSMSYLVDEAMQSFYFRYGIAEHIKVLRWEHFLEQMIDNLDKYSITQLAQFLCNFSDQQLRQIIDDSISKDELENYLNTFKNVSIDSEDPQENRDSLL